MWTTKMNKEIEQVKVIFTDQIRLSPFDPEKKINILTVFYQNIDDSRPGKDVTIVNANSSSLKESQLQCSTVDCEVLALKFPTDACGYYLYAAPP